MQRLKLAELPGWELEHAIATIQSSYSSNMRHLAFPLHATVMGSCPQNQPSLAHRPGMADLQHIAVLAQAGADSQQAHCTNVQHQ